MAGYIWQWSTGQIEGTFSLPPPIVTSIDPVSGTALGGTAFTITGSDFEASGAGANTVTFDGNAATSVVTVNDTTITGVTPAGFDTVDVVVTNSNGSDTLVNGFTYILEGEGEVILTRDRDLSAAVQLTERAKTLTQDRDLGAAVQLTERAKTLTQDRDLGAAVQLKTRRPG